VNFLAPLALALAVLLPVIVALYLLKLRRTEHEISSTYLWRKMIRDVEANAPWQKLKPNLLLFLQLLFLAAIILAAARPFTTGQDAVGQNLILILDSSASMSASDVRPTRLEAAKNRAAQIVDEAPGDRRVTVIEAGTAARLRVSATSDLRLAHQAIEEIQAGMGGSQLGLALELASAVASRQPDTDIFVLSDGRGTLPERLIIHGRLHYVQIGLSAENQAVSQFNLEYLAGGGLQAFIQVSNYGSQPAQRRLDVLADGRVVSAYDLELPAESSESVVAADLPGTGGMIEARLEGSDPLAADDAASVVVRRPAPVKVALVTSGNLFLSTALGLLPNVALSVVQPGEALPAQGADLVIYDRSVPENLPAEGALWFIAPPKSTPFFSVTGLVESPAIRAVDSSDPLLRSVSLDGVNILDSVGIALPGWANTALAGDLADGSSIPLLIYGEQGSRRTAILAFDLSHSDFPLNIAFPITLANTLNWLVPPGEGSVPAALRPGETLAFDLPAGAAQAVFTLPDGKRSNVQAAEGRAVFSNTDLLGVYQVQWLDGQPIRFAVNLFSPLESNINSLDNLPGVEAQAGQASAGAQPGQREWWRWLALAALLLLVAEWLVYQRAALRRLLDAAAHRLKRPVPPGGALRKD